MRVPGPSERKMCPPEGVLPWHGLPAPREDTRRLKDCVVFGQPVFPREAVPALALITLSALINTATRQEVGRWKGSPRYYLVDEKMGLQKVNRNAGATPGGHFPPCRGPGRVQFTGCVGPLSQADGGASPVCREARNTQIRAEGSPQVAGSRREDTREPRRTEVRAASGFPGSAEWGNATGSSATRVDADADERMPPESGTPEGNRLLPTISPGCSRLLPPHGAVRDALATCVGTVES